MAPYTIPMIISLAKKNNNAVHFTEQGPTSISSQTMQSWVMVVMSRDDYLSAIMSHLKNQQFDEKLPLDPNKQFLQDTTILLAKMFDREIINRECFKFIQSNMSEHSSFIYFLNRTT